MMKKKFTLLLAFCGLFAMMSTAQIIQAVNTDYGVWGPVNNTGLAIAPFYHWNAVAFDDGSGNYYIQWRDAATSAILDDDMQQGENPDVAYYANADALVVAYEFSSDIYVDDYYLQTVTPTDYQLGSNNGISSGTNPNIDMNSQGEGVLVWQDGSDIYACAFTIGPFNMGPVVLMGNGDTPDIALLDDNSNVVIAYTQGSQLQVETFDFGSLQSGSAAMSSAHSFSPSGMGFEHPRVQANRNANYGAADMYTVVAQDDLGGSQYLIHGVFYTSFANPTHQKLNLHAYNCFTPDPLPVVAYDRSEVHVAWAQQYDFACSGINPVDNGQDVLMAECDFAGNNINGPTVFREVNEINANFSSSATSLNTEYDGFYSINGSNYCEGVAFDYPGDLLWKVRDPSTPSFRTAGSDKFTITVDKGVTENIITVEVMTGDETVTANDLEMTFALYDQSGRVVDIPAFEQNEMVYRIDASSLEHGIYLLHYTLNGETKAVRVPHFIH